MAGETLPGMASDVWARPAGAPVDDDGAARPIPGDVPLQLDVPPGEYQTWAPRGAVGEGETCER